MTKRQQKIKAMIETATCDELLDDQAVQAEVKAQEGRRALKYLKELCSVDGSQWTSAYVRRLATLAHCYEILALHKAEAVAKAVGRLGDIEPTLEHEIADLWCILEMHRSASQDFKALCAERALRFMP